MTTAGICITSWYIHGVHWHVCIIYVKYNHVICTQMYAQYLGVSGGVKLSSMPTGTTGIELEV